MRSRPYTEYRQKGTRVKRKHKYRDNERVEEDDHVALAAQSWPYTDLQPHFPQRR